MIKDPDAAADLERLRMLFQAADDSKSVQFSISSQDARWIRIALDDLAHWKKKIASARKAIAAGENPKAAFPELFSSEQLRPSHRPPDPRAYSIALRYRYLTGQVPEWACVERIENGKNILPWDSSEPVAHLEALRIIESQYEFKSEISAWKCLDRYRQRRKRQAEAGGMVTVLHPRWIVLPQKP